MKKILVTWFHTWGSGNHHRCPPTETIGGSDGVTGSRNWNKWLGSQMVFGCKNGKKGGGERNRGFLCVRQEGHASAFWKVGRHAASEAGLWARSSVGFVPKTHKEKE